MDLIETVTETGSTNRDLLDRLRAREQLPEGFWLVADRQSAGRGRQGREWVGHTGNFMGSTLVKAGRNDPPAPSLALVAGLAAHEAVSSFAAQSQDWSQKLVLKWPNDLLIGKAKLGGILLEGTDGAVVIGVGVNLAQAPQLPDRDSIALSDFGPPPDRDIFARRLVDALAAQVEKWRNFGMDALIRRWLSAAHPLGTFLTVHEPDGVVLTGTFDGLEPDGALRLRLADGTSRAIHAGDVIT